MQSNPVPLTAAFERQRQAFAQAPYPDLALRRHRLERLRDWLQREEAAFVAAIDADFQGRAAQETRLAELFVVNSAIRHALRHLASWMKPRRVATALPFRPGYNRLVAQPLGVVGIVSPWNYPLQLALGPAVAALAAGNRVLLKPSEFTPRLTQLLSEGIAARFSADEFAVIDGAAEVSKAFVQLPFDHLFFTGSTAVGREVAKAAAANLTPVTLELGGKSPAIIDASCDVPRIAARLAFGKLLNAGQTCVAPDYLLVPAGRSAAVAQELIRAITRLYPRLGDNPDYTAILNPRQRARLSALVEDARAKGAQVLEVNPAGEALAASPKFPPTLLLGVNESAQVMQEEIFGPVLPIEEYHDFDDALRRVNRRPRPLALYWFGSDNARRERIVRETHSGGVTFNDCLWHLVQEEQPFGGIGASGCGAYHGKWGFDTFSKLKPLFHQPRWSATALLQPPYGRRFDRLLRILTRLF